MARVKGQHYVSNQDFFHAIVAYQEASRKALAEGKDKPKIPRYIAECVMKIAQKLAHRPNFSGYSYRDDMVGDAAENMIGYGVQKFDPTRTQNPFAYFTQIAWNAFRLRIQKEKKQSYVKYKTMENMFINGEWSDHQEGDDSFQTSSKGAPDTTKSGIAASFSQHVSEFVRTYEDSQQSKKEKKRQGALDKLIEDGATANA